MNNKTNKITLKRLILKVIILFILINLFFAIIPSEFISQLTIYNAIVPGRERFPFGENPSTSFNLTTTDIDAMVASHKVSGLIKEETEFRIFLVGDSSIWGYLQQPGETLSGLLQKDVSFECDQRRIKIFNLGYPSLSVLKDLAIIEKTSKYNPDLVLWFVTLESLFKQGQLETPLIKNNPELANHLNKKYQLDFDKRETPFIQRTILANRRNLADLLRLQLYGLLWAGSNIDQEYPANYTKALRDFDNDNSYKNMTEMRLLPDDLMADLIIKTQKQNPRIDFVLINEPILISKGENSQIRYNFYYPRWAYDQYREILQNFLQNKSVKYYDFWDLVPEKEFTNSAIHLSPAGERLLAENTINILKLYCQNLDKQ